ncbi:hypothetical protein HKD37_08G023211 [Glycine soja]
MRGLRHNIEIPNAMSRKENLISELHPRKGTWKIAVCIIDMWDVKKHNVRQAIDMVLIDQTDIKVVENQSEYKVSPIPYLLYFVKTTSVKEVERPEIHANVHVITEIADIISGIAPRHTLVDVVGVVAELDDAIEKNHFVREPLLYVNSDDIVEIRKFRDSLCVPYYVGGLTKKGSGSQSQYTSNSQRSDRDKFLHNAQMVSLGDISRLREDCFCLIVAMVDEVLIDTPWSYGSYPNCTTTFDPLKIVGVCRSCQNQVSHTVPRYKLVLKWNTMGRKLTFIFGMQRVSKCSGGDEIKVFPECVDDLVGKTLALRFKYRSSVMDVSQEEHHIHTLTFKIGLQDERTIGKSPVSCAETSSGDYHSTSADYDPGNTAFITPAKRLSGQQATNEFDYEDTTAYEISTNKHIKANLIIHLGDCHVLEYHIDATFIIFATCNNAPPKFLGCIVIYQFQDAFHVDRVSVSPRNYFIIPIRKYNNIYYFVDGLKQFRRQLNIYEGVMVHFMAPNNNTTFHLHFTPPLERQTCGRPRRSTRNYVLTIDITQPMISHATPLLLPPEALNLVGPSSLYMTIQRSSGRRLIWTMSMDNGVRCLAGPWYRFLMDNNLMAGDVVAFYFQPNQHQLIWDDEGYSFDDPPTEDDAETDQNENVDTPYENQNTAMMWYDERINKDKQIKNPKFALCCSDEKIQLPVLQDAPQSLRQLLFDTNDSQAKNFQQNIRSYNVMFAFTSPGLQLDTRYNTKRGSPTFHVHGQGHHLIGSLLPLANKSPKFAQLYIYDTDNKVNNRLSQNPMARDKLQSSIVSSLKLKLIYDRQSDGRLYNLPNTVEVAALIVGDEHTGNHRDIIIEKKKGQIFLIRIIQISMQQREKRLPCVNIFVTGCNQGTIKLKQYCMQGDCFSNRLLMSQNLNFVRQHQQQLRVDKYINLNACNNAPETLGNEKGKRVILPSSFVGSQRYMEQLYFDGMAICGHIGFLDLFLTLTCNPAWPEIQRKVRKSNLTPHDCPDVVSQIFKIKLNQLINDLKRGHYPNPEDIDKIISTEIPNNYTDPELYEIVSKHMIHGPCGLPNRSAPCMVNRKCIRFFPKKFNEATIVDQDGFLVYRRTNDGRMVQKHGIELDNRFISTIATQIQDTLNVEWCNQSTSIKYLFKTKTKDNIRLMMKLNSILIAGMSRPLKHVGRFLHSLCMDMHQQLSVSISTLKINSQFTRQTTNKLGQYYLRVPSKNQCLQLGCIQIKYTMVEGILLILNMCPNSFMLHTRYAGSQENKEIQ